jgi:Zn-dependent peptidase ImmA (M78 family)/DNA-binding XRE family transcriptional regulator
VTTVLTPSRLTIARKRREYTKKSLADAVGVTGRMISFYESGSKSPSAENLSKLAEVLRFPIEFFSGEQLEEPLLESASFRAMRAMTSAQRDAAYAAGALAIHLSKWIEAKFVLPEPNIPILRGFLNPEAAAQALRAEWRLGERPIGNMVDLLEAHGVRVFSLPTDSKRVDAFSVWQGQIPFLFVNTAKSGERIRFDGAHELAHLTLHQHGKPSGRVAEYEADRFASAFLMPKGSVLADLPRNPTLTVLINKKRKWGVAASALAHRLHDVGLASDWNYRSLCIELAKQGWSKEPQPIAKEASQVLSKVLAALRNEGVRFSSIARDLALEVEELSSLMFGLAIIIVQGGRQGNGNGGKGPTNNSLRLVE